MQGARNLCGCTFLVATVSLIFTHSLSFSYVYKCVWVYTCSSSSACPAIHALKTCIHVHITTVTGATTVCTCVGFQVIVVEDDNGNLIRETMKDTDTLARYKTMHETLVYLSHLDHNDTELQMLEKLREQVRSGKMS